MADDEHNCAGVRQEDREHNAAGGTLSDVGIFCKSEYPGYAYNSSHDIWTLVTLKAPCQEETEGEEEKRAPIDLVAVIDKSGSMSGEKINLVKKTLEFVLTQLTDKDRLAIVTYDAQVYLDFGLRNMSKEGKEFALNKIQAITDGSTTNLCGGLMKGLCQMIDRKEKNDVASVLLFTDGLANNGITSRQGIVAAMQDPKRFDGPCGSTEFGSGGLQIRSRNRPQQQQPQQQAPQQRQSWLRNIFGGNSNTTPNTAPQPQVPEAEESQPVANTSSSTTTTTSDYSVYTFGFGADHDPDMLKDISDAGNGMYYFIENVDKIAESFGHCLGGLMSTVAQGIQMKVDLEEGVTIKEIHTVKPFEKINDKSVKVNIGDLQSEESRDVVLELTITAVDRPYNVNQQPIFKVCVDYFNVITNELAASNGNLGVLRPEPADVVHDNSTRDTYVEQQLARVKMTKAMKLAASKADKGELVEARRLMSQQKHYLGQLKVDATNDEFRDHYLTMEQDIASVEATYESDQKFQSRGKKLQSNLVQQYGAQRSNNLTSAAFMTKGKQEKRSKSLNFVKK